MAAQLPRSIPDTDRGVIYEFAMDRMMSAPDEQFSHIVGTRDLFLVPTIRFAQLYVLVIGWLARSELVWINATSIQSQRGSNSN